MIHATPVIMNGGVVEGGTMIIAVVEEIGIMNGVGIGIMRGKGKGIDIAAGMPGMPGTMRGGIMVGGISE